MGFEIAVVLTLFGVTVLVFAREWLPIEVWSLLLMVVLVLTGILTPAQAFMGFANSAVIMIAGIMILTGGIIHNGAADRIARQIRRYAGRSETRTAALLLGVVNGVSAVINNIAATAMFIPVAEAMATHWRVPRGRYLMPIAFASMTGGMCTLIGTSTNVAVSGAMDQFGLRPLGFFELAPVGVTVALAGIAYFLWVMPRLLRLGPEDAAVEAFGVKEFMFEVIVRPGAAQAGRTLRQADLARRFGLNVLAIVRGRESVVTPQSDEVIREGDLPLVAGEAWTIEAIRITPGLDVKSLPDLTLPGADAGRAKMVEVTLSYNSPFIGKTLQEIGFRQHYDLSVLAIHRRGEAVTEKVGKIPLRTGDVLLIHGREDRFDLLEREPTMLLMESVLPKYHPSRALLSSVILIGAIASAASGWLDSPTAFLAGATLVMLFRCLSADEAGSYLNVRFLVMLAGMVSLGTAMERSGAAVFLADAIMAALGSPGPTALLAVFFVLTVILTQPLSNAAAALLVLPVAIHVAEVIAADPRPFAIIVALAASCSFITPFEPACLLVYSTGRYRFVDFLKAGSLLTLLAFAICMVLVPILWPFR